MANSHASGLAKTAGRAGGGGQGGTSLAGDLFSVGVQHCADPVWPMWGRKGSMLWG